MVDERKWFPYPDHRSDCKGVWRRPQRFGPYASADAKETMTTGNSPNPRAYFESRKMVDERTPRISVVIPAFNEAHYIADTLVSLARQDFDGEYEVIVIDNNSSDDTAAVAVAYGASVVFEADPGVCSARQRGVELARGEIVVSTDADTTFDSGWLSRIDSVFALDSGCVAVAGPCRFVDGPWWALYTRILFTLVYLVYRVTGRVLYATATNIAFRKTAWTGYDTRLTQGGDELDLLRRLRERGKVVFRLDNPTFTSSRRLRVGLLYNIVVTFLLYYVLGYLLNRITRRKLLGTAPAFRHESCGGRSWLWRLAANGGTLLVALGVFGAGHVLTLTREFLWIR